MEPPKVPEVLKQPISIKTFALIFLGIAALQTFLYLHPEPDSFEEPLAFLSMGLPLAVSIGAFSIATRYGMSQVFGKSYLFFALAFFSVFLAEVTYYTYDVIFEIDPYPSIADVFFFALYPFLAAHMLINFKFFKTKISVPRKIIFFAIPILISSLYGWLAYQEIGQIDFDFAYGMIFVIGTSSALSLAVLGSFVFRGGLLGIVWMILLIGVLLTTTGDVWYYYLELFDGYDLLHPVNLFWYASYGIMLYALYKHVKSI